MESGIFDITTYDLMKEYLKDEEEDMYWYECQIKLAEKIGLQNFCTHSYKINLGGIDANKSI